MTPEHNNTQEVKDQSLNYIGYQDDGHHHHHRRKKITKKQKILIIVLFSIIGLIIALVLAFLIMTAIGKSQMVINENAQITTPETKE